MPSRLAAKGQLGTVSIGAVFTVWHGVYRLRS